MFVCPRDKRPLERRKSPYGVYWTCPACGGRAVGVGLLRKTIARDAVSQIWVAARERRGMPSDPCPSCLEPMIQVSSGPGGPTVDVCRACQFVWFDTLEYEMLPVASAPPPAPEQIPERAKEILATAQAEAIAGRAEHTFGAEAPKELWKYLPGILGMPIEYEQSALRTAPWMTWGLIAFICAFSIRAFFNLEQAVTQFGLIPGQWSRSLGLTFLTSFLLHGDPFHLLGNMYFLFVFGDNVEDYLGKARYLLLILAAAVLGDVAHIVLDPRSQIPLIGASGGISGVIAFYALKFPQAKLGWLFRIWFVYFRWIRMPAYVFVGVWILLQFLGAYLQIEGVSSVSALAHLGGAATGLVFWLTYRGH